MSERLTRKQMYEKYPDQFLGISNVTYHGATVLEADVVCQGSRAEIFSKQMQTDGEIRLFSTKPDACVNIGLIEGIHK